ncbi:MAG: nucleoside hydrolase [Candidatus Promineifilaceae bacterium]
MKNDELNRLIIDTDPGEDDALAIMMAAVHAGTTIEAITVVGGNVGLAHTVNNACVVLDQLGLDVPVYAGCHQPLVRLSADASNAHGKDGLGNTGFRSSRPIESEHASAEIVRRANANPQQLTLVTLGPFTNIATALLLDPDLPLKLKRVVSMAGAVTARGNTNVCTEFNVFADADAAFAVFDAWGRAGKVIEVADWELTAEHGFSKAMRAEWAALGTPNADFFTAISAHSNRFIEEVRHRTLQRFADPVAMAVALMPSIVTRSEVHNLVVETDGRFTRGQTIVDWLDESARPKNANIVLEMNKPQLYQLVMDALQ